MPTNNKLVAILSIAAISFILLIIVLFAEVKDTSSSSNSDRSSIDNIKDPNKISSPSSSRRRLKPVPPLVSEEQNNNKKESPVDEFFQSHLEQHPLENCPAGKFYSANDIARHNTEDDLWIVLYGHVLNVTSFVHHHPGGVSMIMKGAASATTGVVVSDVADLFAQYHQPGTISLFNTFCIGKVREGEVKKNW